MIPRDHESEFATVDLADGKTRYELDDAGMEDYDQPDTVDSIPEWADDDLTFGIGAEDRGLGKRTVKAELLWSPICCQLADAYLPPPPLALFAGGWDVANHSRLAQMFAEEKGQGDGGTNGLRPWQPQSAPSGAADAWGRSQPLYGGAREGSPPRSQPPEVQGFAVQAEDALPSLGGGGPLTWDNHLVTSVSALVLVSITFEFIDCFWPGAQTLAMTLDSPRSEGPGGFGAATPGEVVPNGIVHDLQPEPEPVPAGGGAGYHPGQEAVPGQTSELMAFLSLLGISQFLQTFVRAHAGMPPRDPCPICALLTFLRSAPTAGG